MSRGARASLPVRRGPARRGGRYHGRGRSEARSLTSEGEPIPCVAASDRAVASGVLGLGQFSVWASGFDLRMARPTVWPNLFGVTALAGFVLGHLFGPHIDNIAALVVSAILISSVSSVSWRCRCRRCLLWRARPMDRPRACSPLPRLSRHHHAAHRTGSAAPSTTRTRQCSRTPASTTTSPSSPGRSPTRGGRPTTGRALLRNCRRPRHTDCLRSVSIRNDEVPARAADTARRHKMGRRQQRRSGRDRPGSPVRCWRTAQAADLRLSPDQRMTPTNPRRLGPATDRSGTSPNRADSPT